MNSKSKKAIRTLESHREKLASISTVQDGNSWKAALKDMLNLYIGNGSSISKRLDDFFFTKKESKINDRPFLSKTFLVYDDSKKENFINLIEIAIAYINDNGIYQNPNRTNFLSEFKNGTIISGIIVAIGIIYGAGHFLGNLQKERELFKMEKEVNEQKLSNLKLLNEIENLKIENNKLTTKDTTLTQ